MKYAAVFPGQGSQSVGMLTDLAAVYPCVNQTFEEASDTLGYDLWALVQNGPEELLNETNKTQPAILTASVAAGRVWIAQGVPRAAICAGHSLGEYSALVHAGALAFADAVSLVAERGGYMQEAVPKGEGAMAAILGMTDEEVSAICTKAAQGQVVSAASFNAPGQVVVAGHSAAVARAAAAAKAAGAKRAIRLRVSVPSHCELMRVAEVRLTEHLQNTDIKMPEIPVIHNVDVAVQTSVEAIHRVLNEQLHQPVRWTQTIQKIAENAIDAILEFGPAKVLTGFNKRIVKTIACLAVFDAKTLDLAMEKLEMLHHDPEK
ncbi:MAG: ACP S-malonyltransferase [Gammaproteobacteria bacterium]|nr:ACP S-malonyltransferase [Gammaproteobacteria bacterium]